jgi:1-acyl-sn-glycerol-3-phosphate acyltransferase
VAGLEATRALVQAGPVLLAPTHVTWWDPLVLMVLDEALDADSRALMDAENLKALPFFGALGAMPIHRNGSSAATRRDLAAAAAELDRPRRALWVFPQGRQRPTSVRPLGLQPGICLLARQAGVPVIPVALQYGWREGERPAALVHFGTPLDGTDKNLLPSLEAALVAGLAVGESFLDTPHHTGDQVPDGSPFSALVPPIRAFRHDDPASTALARVTRVLTGLSRWRTP